VYLCTVKFEIVHIDETDSTNRWLRENGVGDMVVVADYQTAGRGCGTNSWESERGQNLTFSMLWHPADIPARGQFRISEIVSVALCRVLDGYLGGGVEVKWPNDIYYDGRKLAGILIENRLQGPAVKECIVGIGLNVNQQRFLSDAPNPVSLRQLLGHDVDREELLHAFLDSFETVSLAETTSDDYRCRLFWRTGVHDFSDKNGTFSARIAGVLDDGRLVLEDTSGQRRIYAFKEVQFHVCPRQG
jgi:BirA family biotin operon repressor/biotin-[acetyl-CoA-carboxylase] ligase